MSGTSALFARRHFSAAGIGRGGACRHYLVNDHAPPGRDRCEVTLARFRTRTEPCRTPSGYWDPGFTTTVRPSLLVARDSWIWPQSATTGCPASMDPRIA